MTGYDERDRMPIDKRLRHPDCRCYIDGVGLVNMKAAQRPARYDGSDEEQARLRRLGPIHAREREPDVTIEQMAAFWSWEASR